MSRGQKKYWFPAKRYGWGWGLLGTWQGWLVLGAYCAFVVASIVVFPPNAAPAAFILANCLLASAFVAICRLTGEPPRWRWGDRDED
ncbi:hypothetical protein K9U39_19050 [Rhodoblastus acidophilus]|uniref:Uncharacterized protein n=1 Tax=Candidatus Rhodoblastus alkanivorans TaxID=2954117 RepID=A0ABS9Z2S4_9HYPH|nr:hypothetical protein [Candidatus Rhodoblastus alkanivorans]MCI4679718.1 hypothetical protein [Candidatus Rhodoblastus alkanivorans]MCI4681956.1 hypothetical protein [Candidatus Rhodoblastus alkanivorans]MDI4643006.1 hypothetical protein [Rhodoblastus acidophilus]